METMNETIAKAAVKHLSLVDPILKPIIDRVGLCTITPSGDYYQQLVDAIISQQLSVHAARSIENRFRDLFHGAFPNPEQIIGTDIETLRGLGFSRAKASYVIDLAQHIIDGKVTFTHMNELSNEEIVVELTAVKGIGEWTAHMFLMFCMGRTNVLPIGDIGIRNGVRALYGLADAPTPQQVADIASRRQWSPYETVASWYVWQSLENTPAV